MLAPKRRKKFARGVRTASLHVFSPLANSLKNIGLRSDIQQALIGLRILKDGFSLSIHGQDERPFCFLKVLKEFSRIAAERGHCLDVFFQVEHAEPRENHPSTFKGADLQSRGAALPDFGRLAAPLHGFHPTRTVNSGLGCVLVFGDGLGHHGFDVRLR